MAITKAQRVPTCCTLQKRRKMVEKRQFFAVHCHFFNGLPLAWRK